MLLKAKQFLEFTIELLLAIVAAALIMQFVFMHSEVPSGSMIPTISIGDHFILNKVTPYYRKPERGEIVVFFDGKDNLIKRVIGLPGDELDLYAGNLYVNGVLLDEPYLNHPNSTFPLNPNIVFPLTVPENHFFVMGDNRLNSADSRYFGSVNREDLVAIGGIRVFPFNAIGILK
ncbi:signal peptidase I [Candidatus Epulonipiscium viviparus]|uniref:signal peptidase I n=1 Tax=Candidatus Epulonipiscium viviparus TaxID=420336 RepID=UPI00016C05F0|nr:signal peptidase I [Candidatus Epulopiscium viviparus]